MSLQLPDGDWVSLAKVPRDKGRDVYTIIATTGPVTVAISLDGGATSVNLPELDAAAAPVSATLFLGNSVYIRQTGGGTGVRIG